MKKLLPILIFVLCCGSLLAQDKHFTQFYSSPLTLNPALTGAFGGKYRVSSIYRDQWRGILDSPYSTFAAAADVRFELETRSRYKDAFAVGLLFYNDDVGGIDFSTNQIALSAAFHKGLDFDRKQFISFGFQAGLAQRNINYEDLTFQDQFNGIDGYTFDTFEELPENNFSFSDFSVGLNYSWSPKERTSIFVGAAYHHIFEPQVSFYPEDLGGDSKLFSKLSAQISAEVPITERVSLLPRFLFANQGPHLEINTGTNFRILFNDFSTNSIHVGSWVRPVRNNDGAIGVDAVVLLVGFEFNSFLIGGSYDFNLNDLTTTRQGQGAFEISFTYLGDFENEAVLCPKF